MAGANSNIQMTDLDFYAIKDNLKTYLKSQDTLKDYNYEGSALSTLLDILAYNTQYNAYYLNMVANEMFLDTALLRNSVVSQAKLLNYTPKSAIAPEAIVSINFLGVSDSTLTIPKNTPFLSEAIDGINYNFVTEDNVTVTTISNTATFNNLKLKQGIATTNSFTVDGTIVNPIYEIPDSKIDTTSISVNVQESTTNSSYQIYTLATNYMALDENSMVYFLQEGKNGTYEMYFGDGVLGKKLSDGNIINVGYLVTDGSSSIGSNNFVLMTTISGYSNYTLTPVSAAVNGTDKETIESIKFQAPKSYSAQNRAVTKEDYITAIQQNELGYAFDAVSVWGGQENDPPVYGQIFVSVKPAGSYSLTATQKSRLIQDVIKPISVMTVEPAIVDPDYTYIQITANVYYDPKKTNLTTSELQSSIKTAISNLAAINLNTFNSTFRLSDYNNAINNSNQSIITNEIFLTVQKKIYPNLTTPTTYKLYYGVPLKKGMFQSGVTSNPAVQFRDPASPSNIIDGIYIEEVPSSSGGVETITVINAGFGYQYPPTVTISGDGIGATAEVVTNSNGTIREINVLTPGSGYTAAVATITPQSGDTTGQLGSAVVLLEGRYGTLRTYYNNSNNVKNIFNSNIGTIDYNEGIITLNSFGPLDVDNPLGQLTVATSPTTSIISSTYNRIITVDPFDPNSIVVNIITKTT